MPSMSGRYGRERMSQKFCPALEWATRLLSKISGNSPNIDEPVIARLVVFTGSATGGGPFKLPFGLGGASNADQEPTATCRQVQSFA